MIESAWNSTSCSLCNSAMARIHSLSEEQCDLTSAEGERTQQFMQHGTVAARKAKPASQAVMAIAGQLHPLNSAT
jgi:hypothetical protein